MSVSHPLLKKLKAFVIALRSKDEPVKDSHQLLLPLCETIEKIFLQGLKATNSWFGQPKTECHPFLAMSVSAVKKNKKTRHDVGRGRNFMRTALVKKVLTGVTDIMKNNFDFRNVYKQYELVPSDDLGLDIRTVKGYPLITQGHYSDGSVYGPIRRLLQTCDISDLSPATPTSPGSTPWGEMDHRPPPEATYQTTYLGKVLLGKDGRVGLIEYGVAEVLNMTDNKQNVILELGEKEVKVIDRDTNEAKNIE
ncbi:hypothetical protein MAR_028129, partial [Mya arenaria]